MDTRTPTPGATDAPNAAAPPGPATATPPAPTPAAPPLAHASEPEVAVPAAADAKAAGSKWPPDPSPEPDPPKLHNPTADELKTAKENNDKGLPVAGSAEHAPATHTMEQCLPEKPTPNKDGFVELGNLKVEAAHYQEFRQAMMFESKNAEATGIVERLEKGPNKTTVTMNHDTNNEMVPNSKGGADVHWDPSHMHIAENGAKRSPATRLAHELDHADEWTHNPQRMLTNSNVSDPKFDNLEEKRVITGSERRNVKALGEGERDDHHPGANFETKGVTSTTPVLHQTRNGVTTELKDGYSQTGRITKADENSVTQEIGRGQTVTYPRNEFQGMVGFENLKNAVMDGKPMNVAVQGNEIKMSAGRDAGKELSNVR